MDVQVLPLPVGQTLIAHEHESGLDPQGSWMHISRVPTPLIRCRHTNPGGHWVVPHADPAAQLAVWSDHAPLRQVAVVSDPSCGHWSYGQV